MKSKAVADNLPYDASEKGGAGMIATRGPHKRMWEYDGAFKCLDCKKQWGALPGHPEMPSTCVEAVADTGQVESRSFLKRKAAMQGKPAPTFVADTGREAAFQKIMGAMGMPDNNDPSYDEWLFDQTWQAATAAERWISVDEKLPEDGMSAVIFVPGWDDLYLRYRVAWIDYDESPPVWIFDGHAVSGVTYWQPLPEPPAAIRGKAGQ